MDRLESMSVLVAVVDAGSLSTASRKLGMPIATVSRKISELEAHLRTRLLNRSTRRLSLTDVGRSYVADCRRILEDIGEVERAALGEFSAPKGDLVITAPIVYGRLHVVPIVAAFLEAHPEIDIRLILADRVMNLMEEHVDIAVRIGELPDSNLIVTTVGTTRRVVCASPQYFAARGIPKIPQDLANHSCITFEGLGSGNPWSFPVGKTETSVVIRSRLVVTTAEAAIDAAIGGLGVTRVLSYQLPSSSQLALALTEYEPAPRPICLVHFGQRLLPLKVRAFLEFAAPRLKARLVAATRAREQP